MKNLTNFQQKLVDDLINEFERINPKEVETNTKKRFDLNAINEVIGEEGRLIDTMKKHNQTMIKVFENQFKEEVKAFKKEFGKTFDFQIGYQVRNNEGYLTNRNDIAEWLKYNNEHLISPNESGEMRLFIVSKTRTAPSSDRANYCNGMACLELFADFKRERVEYTLETSKKVILFKIVGMQYRAFHSYLYKEKTLNTSTIDELLQNNKDLQRRMVELIK